MTGQQSQNSLKLNITQVLFYKPYNSKNSREINSDVAVFAMKTL